MQPLKLDDNFLRELGLDALPEEQRQDFLQHVLETLELRVGTRLSEGLREKQLKEFEKLTPTPEDSKEVAQQKQAMALQWLEENRPGYKNTVADELGKLKEEIKSNAGGIIEENNTDEQQD